MRTEKMYSCKSSHTCLILLIFAVLTSFGFAHYDGDFALGTNDIVNVYYHGKWGTICPSGSYSDLVPKVICRNLGLKYESYRSTYSTIWSFMSNLKCRGDEKSIHECYYSEMFEDYYCSSRSRLSVHCSENPTQKYCSFDNDMCGMFSKGKMYYTWKRVYPGSHSKPLRLNTDHTTKSEKGKYMLVSAAGFPGQKAYLETQAFDKNMQSLSFYYHMFGTEMGSLNIYIQKDSGKTRIHSISGNQGNTWKHVCLHVAVSYGNHEIVFEAVQGNGLDGDIAIDDVTISADSCSSNWNVSCNFNEDTCNYDIESNYESSGWRIQKIYGLRDNSGFGEYLVHSGMSSGWKESLTSPIIDIPSKSKVEFYYYMPGTENAELQVRFVNEGHKSWFTKTPYFWEDFGDHRNDWNLGCMDLPSERGRIIFTGISRSRDLELMALDDIRIDEGYCQTGIANYMCTFNNPLICEYAIKCMNPNEFTWRRITGETTSTGTGPTTDYSSSKDGYYMYAESSYGKPNDTTELSFHVSNVKGNFLKFAYHMYGSEVGQLDILFNAYESDEKMAWTEKGNKGMYWHSACVYIDHDINDITFIAVRGDSYLGDIAIDSVLVEKQGCPGPFDCTFENGLCNYNVSKSDLEWEVHAQNVFASDTNSYLYIHSDTNMENALFEMKSPEAFVKENSSVSFRYKMTGRMKEMAVFTDDYSTMNKSWSSKYNDITEFTSACVDFPFSNNVVLIFQVIADINSYEDADAYFDDIFINNETCKSGIAYHFCKFREVHLCNYHVECPENTHYNWSRGSVSHNNDNNTINNTIQSIPEGPGEYFMFTDSSSGRIEDETHLIFSNVAPPTGHNFFFSYYIETNSGKLRLHLENLHGKNLMFEEFSDVASMWQSACIHVDNSTIADFIFTAVRGYGFAGSIAVTDVGFKQEDCQARSISCNFSDKMICQYGSIGDMKWERKYLGNLENSTDGFYVEASPGSGKSLFVSPTENITNSCVQIRYKIFSNNCNLAVYNAFNNKIILSIVGDNTTAWEIAQTYIQEELTKLVFSIENVYAWANLDCTVLLDYVNVTENNCTQLDCPAGTRTCKNDYCYRESKVCDGIKDCSDGSDEENCPTSITCDFKSGRYCGYKILDGWRYSAYHSYAIDITGSMEISETKGKMRSPYLEVEDSCVNFKYITHNQANGDLSIIWNQWNNLTSRISHSLRWKDEIVNQKDGFYEGQFQLPAGKGFLEFEATMHGHLAIYDVTVSNGTCLELNCSKHSQSCLDNSKCVVERNFCNNYWNCPDGSDETNCTTFFTCDFEDSDMCGFKSFPETDSWRLGSGLSGERPKLDHSERTYEGHYVEGFSQGETHLYLPNIITENSFCLNFYYTFFGGGQVSVHDNDSFLMGLSKFDVDMWRNVKITLPKGKHSIYFAYSNNNMSDMYPFNNVSGTVAFDSLSINPGDCSHTECEDNWNPCKDNYTCFAYNTECDGISNCANGEDEYNCSSNEKMYKLIGGRSLQSGSVQKLYGSEYLPVCIYSSNQKLVKDICSALGFEGTVTKQLERKRITGSYYDCSYSNYLYCNNRLCSNCTCFSLYVTCSNTTCQDGEVICPQGHNGTGSTDVCIRQESLCDGETDCEGGTDEMNCDQCTHKQWQCSNKKCIMKDLRCNGIKNCDDGSDEFHCFKYMNNTITVFYNDSYEYICENSLFDKSVANQLCSSVGKSNGTFADSVVENGLLFKANIANSNNQLIPGFKSISLQECKVMMLDCSEQQCGTRKTNSIEPSIQHGQDVLEGEWPWIAQIFRNSDLVCTGSVVSSNFVLTASHCVRDARATFYVQVGSIKRFQGIQYKVSQITRHEGHKNVISGNDIALLYIETEIKMSSLVQPICLPEHPVTEADICYIIGWGRNEQGKYLPTLQETKAYVLEETYCRKYYSFLTETIFCGNYKEDNQPICFGDSGGPFACRNKHGQWVAYGVSSFVKSGCLGKDSDPAGFANIYNLMPWIKKHM